MGNNSKPRRTVGVKITTATKVQKIADLIEEVAQGIKQVPDPDLADRMMKSLNRLCRTLNYDRRGWIRVKQIRAFRLIMQGYNPLIIAADSRWQAQFQAALWLNGGDGSKPIRFNTQHPAVKASVRRAPEYDSDALKKDRPCVLYMEQPAEEASTQ